jgi:hypothetical protein
MRSTKSSEPETVRAAGGRVLLVPRLKGHSTTSLVRRAAD